MTIEASIVMPLIFAMIGALIYMGIVMYQRVYLQSLADFIAERTAATWSSANKDIITGQRTAVGDSLYTDLYDHEKGKKSEKLKEFCKAYIDKYSILKSVGINEVEPKVENFIFYKKVTVIINAKYKMLGKGLFSYAGMNSDEMPLSVKAEAIVSDQVEFIRNIDFIGDMVSRLADKNGTVKNITSGYDKFLGKLNTVVDNIGKFTSQGVKK